MARLTPQYLHGWLNYEKIIQAPEVRSEFMNLYDELNGNLDADNIKDNSITSAKLVNETVTNDKIKNVAANKVIGKLTASQLPVNVFYADGGGLQGPINFTGLDHTVPLLKSDSATGSIIFQSGTGPTKLVISAGVGDTALKITYGGVELLTVYKDGRNEPKQLVIPEL